MPTSVVKIKKKKKKKELLALVPCMMSAYLALHQLHAQLTGASFTIKPFKLQQVHDASHFVE